MNALFENMWNVNEQYRSASVIGDGDTLCVSTGNVQRRWKWTGKGLVTVGFKDLQRNREWVNIQPAHACDWSLPGVEDVQDATLVSLEAAVSSDEGFTSEHLAVTAEVTYPGLGIDVKYVIWAYPEAAGLRTQLLLRKSPGSPDFAVDTTAKASAIQILRGHCRVPAELEALPVPEAFKSFVGIGEGPVELSLGELNPEKNYALGLSWWDHGGRGSCQSVTLSSMDGESAETVIENAALPTSLDHSEESSGQLVVPVPYGLTIGGAVNMRVQAASGVTSINEVWLYEEEAPGTKGHDVSLPDDRNAAIRQAAPNGFRLHSYLNCGADGSDSPENIDLSRVDYLPVDRNGLSPLAIAYNSDTQNRHRPETHLLKEESPTTSAVSWASILCLEDEPDGFMMVKESHKCANQSGVRTGVFIFDDSGLANTGMLLGLEDLCEDRYRACWASWSLVYEAREESRSLALQQFDRIRFPVKLSRDLYIKADTWGSGNGSRESRDKATEVEVLKEIDSVADLGLDGLQIDDGWQVNTAGEYGEGWYPHPDIYPEGWKNVIARAEQKGVRMGLWAPAEAITLDELKWNYDQVGFWTWKLDFAQMTSPDKIEQNITKVRDFLSYTNHEAEVVWDVTERAPRYGYFWAREYGCMWLSNRKPDFPESVIPSPWIMLRENWELAKYLNLNKFQLPVQNFSRVNKAKSDAAKHSESYAVALGLMGIPVFFQTTYYYEEDARDEIRDLLARYKQHREEMFTSYVFPIGQEPSNGSWTGFQWYHPDRSTGYLVIFREINNEEKTRRIALRFLSDVTLRLHDIRTGKEETIDLDGDGQGLFSIESPADFLFCRYQFAAKKR